MGSQYSVGPFPRDVKDLVNMDLIQLQSKIYRFERLLDRYHNDNVFMNRKQFQWTFQFNEITTYKLFQKFDPELKGHIATYDLWCALALASTAPTSEKINFIFYLIDLNHDNYVSPLDLTLILRCSTRGFANLKGIIHVPLKTINVLVTEAFHRTDVILNESGEISLRDIRPYFLIDDKPRTYLSNLGTLIVVEDSSKLIEQRAELLKELAEVEMELHEVESKYYAKQSDQRAYESERGGDAHLVRLTEKLLSTIGKQEPEPPKDSLNLTSEEKQRLRREQRLLEAAGEVFDENSTENDRTTTRDGGAFSRGCKPVAMTGSGGSESAILDAILFKWTTLKPQSADKLVKLDLDTLLDLFEAAGITISDEHAMDCLQSLPCNLIGRHNVQDVIVWLRRYTIDSSLPSSSMQKRLPLWRRELFQYRQQFLGWVEWIQEWLTRINYQDLSFKEVQKYQKKLQERLILLEQNDETNSLSSQATSAMASTTLASTATATVTATGGGGASTLVPPSAKSPVGKKSQKSSTFENIIKGSIRLSGWQRHRQMSRPTKCAFLATFGPPIVNTPSSTAATTATAPKKATNSITSILKPKTEPKPDYRGKISVEFFTKPEGKKRESLLSGDGIVRDFGSITPGDLMHHFDHVGYVVELSEAERASEAAYAAARAAGLNMSGSSEPSTASKPSTCIVWILFRVSENATSQEAFCLLKTATNFFESIPLDYRHELYTSTKGQLFYLEANSSLTPINSTQSNSNSNSTKSSLPRVVCVALLHERDPYKAMEDQIKSTNLVYTRLLRSLKIDFRLLKSLKELYEESLNYESFQDKLFGPQEDELGEEGMNPLRFAKMCRKRQVAAQEAIEKAPTMPLEELKLHLSTRGLSTRGTKEELISRVQMAFKQQVEMIGFGEMSGFGAMMVKKIFEMFDEDKDGAFSLMEMNKFLLATGAEAFYDMKAYKSMMLEEGFLLDSHYRLTLEGLTAYYERYGRLARDINELGLGSLNQTGQGEMEVRIEYESDAVYSLYGILEPHSLAQRTLKHILGTISSTNDLLLTGNFPHLENLFTLLRCHELPYLKSIFEGIKRPGWISNFIHSTCEWLADGENGLIPSLRANSRAKLNNYSNFTKQFQKWINPISGDGSVRHAREGEGEGGEGGEEGEEDNETTDSSMKLRGRDRGRGRRKEMEMERDDDSDSASSTTRQTPLPSAANQIDSYLNDNSQRKLYVNMFQIFYKNNKIKPIDSSNNSPDDEDEMEKYLPLEPKHPEIERWIQHLDALLPRIIAYSSKKTLMNDEINELLTSAANIYNRLSGNERFTRTERDRLQFLKLKCERRAEKLITQLEESVHLCGAHFLSFYDAFRLYGDGISQIGCGTNELGLKLNFEGMDWQEFLPDGMGELCSTKQKESEKYERAMQRKNAALNAIERERLRRDLDEEEREKRRLWEIANAQLARDEEEKTLFEEVYSLLLESREEKLSSQDIDEMIASWKHLLELRETRYPNTMKVAVCLNDLACVIFELCADRPILIAEAVSYFRNSAEISMKVMETILRREVAITEGSIDAKTKLIQMLNEFSPSSSSSSSPPSPPSTTESILKRDATLASTDGIRTAFMPNSPASFLLLLVNFLTSLRLSKNTDELNDEFGQKVKEALFVLNELLSEKERTNIQLERRMELFAIFPLGDIKEYLKLSSMELEEHRKQYHIRCEKERLKKRLEEFKGVPNTRKEGLIMTKTDQQIGMEMLALVDPKKAARIKFHRQQKEARKKRTQSIKERNKMYRMIASDEISALFFQQAKKTDEESELEWGDDKLLVVDDPFKAQNNKSKSGKNKNGKNGKNGAMNSPIQEEGEGEGEGEEEEGSDGDHQSEASDDSFASKLKKVKHVVDTSLANVQFEPNKPMYVRSPGREEGGGRGGGKKEEEEEEKSDVDGKVDTKSEVSSLSELTTPATFLNQISDPTKSIRRESRIMSWLMRNRGGK